MTWGLRNRVTLAFGAVALLVAIVISVSTFALARWYLTGQRESSGITRTQLNARVVDGALASDVTTNDALTAVPSSDDSQALVNLDGQWYTRSLSIRPDQLPADLLMAAGSFGGARERFEIAGVPQLAVAVPINGGTYVEVYPLGSLDRSLRLLLSVLIFASLLAAFVGAMIGRYMGNRVLRPLLSMSSAARAISRGDINTRIKPTNDPDLDVIATSFNDMADAVEARIVRERRFAANVSHELRSPLTAMVGTVDLLDGSTGGNPERDRELIKVLANQTHRLSNLVLALLEVSQITAKIDAQEEPVALLEVAREVVDAQGLDAGLVSGDNVVVQSDERRLDRILTNLVENAQSHGRGLIAVTVYQEPDGARIEVDDNGPGIPVAEQKRVFEPFSRGSTASTATGAGLGLALVVDQAAAIGTEVTVTDRPGGGTRFVVQIPHTNTAVEE